MEVDKEIEHEEVANCSFAGALTFVFGLIGGTFSSVACKMAFEFVAEGEDGQQREFAKPIAVVLLMFAAMVPAFFFWLILQARRKPHEREVITMRMFLLLIIPCICDLLCTLLLAIAQLYLTVSLWQMMRGTVIIITAILKRVVLNHKLRAHMWSGVGLIGLAMVIVASSSLIYGDDASATTNSRDPKIGMLLVLLGCLAQGVQYIFEEKVMAVDDVPPLVVIGFEGIWGTILCVFIFYPLAYFLPGSDVGGCFENPIDTITMVAGSKELQAILLWFMVTVTVYNCLAVYVTRYLSAIWHAILDNFRPITVWALDLAIYYLIFPDTGFGERWTRGSNIQLLGIVFLLVGTAVYNGSVFVCDEAYMPLLVTDNSGDSTPELFVTDMSVGSPCIARPPRVTHGTSHQDVDGHGNIPSKMSVVKRYSEV